MMAQTELHFRLVKDGEIITFGVKTDFDCCIEASDDTEEYYLPVFDSIELRSPYQDGFEEWLYDGDRIVTKHQGGIKEYGTIEYDDVKWQIRHDDGRVFSMGNYTLIYTERIGTIHDKETT